MVVFPKTYVSLFSGIGGLDLAVKLAMPQSRCLLYVENEANAAERLVARIQDGALDDAPIWSDVSTLQGDVLKGHAEMVVGGFPCVGISNAGKREGLEDDRSGLWREMLRAVREIRPRYVFVENVSALLVRGGHTVLGDLAESGYDAEWLTLSVKECGGSQIRNRIFVLAYDQSARGRLHARNEPAKTSESKRAIRSGRVRKQQRAAVDEQLVACSASVARGDSIARSAEPEQQSGQWADEFGRGGDAVDNAAGPRLPQAVEGTDAGRHQQRGERLLGDGRGDVADNDAQGERRLRERAESAHALHGGGGGGIYGAMGDESGRVTYWPPGPSDADAWRAALEIRPDLAPAIECSIRGMVAGTSDRVVSARQDELRGLGNLVVPVQGALAMLTLWERCFGRAECRVN